MEFRRIGPLEVSALGLGCNNFGRELDQGESAEVVKAALDIGINHFDTADVYGYGDHRYSGRGRSEEYLGRAIGSLREEVIVATKFGNPMGGDDPAMQGGSRSWVHRACEASLRRLGTDYIDLYQIHMPDTATPIAETLGALTALVAQGKVRAIGCSNFTAPQLEEAESVSGETDLARFASVQNEYSLLRREVEQDVLPTCERLDIAFLPYFPLASGLLTGKYRKGRPAPDGSRLSFWEARPHLALEADVLDRVENLTELARTFGHTILELAISWLLARPQVASVIAGATTPDQVRRNCEAARWSISADDLSAIDAQLGSAL
jgi:aryl-alcohol dehydrogenase-like predicted oxidoreductase